MKALPANERQHDLVLENVVITGPTELFCSTGSNTPDMTLAEFSGGVMEVGVTTRVTVAMLRLSGSEITDDRACTVAHSATNRFEHHIQGQSVGH